MRNGQIRVLGAFDATMIVVGNVVGVGIFTTSGIIAGELAHPYYILGIWIVGGILTLAGALTYSELAAAMPCAGGDYNYLRRTYGLWAGFLLGWIYFFVIMPGSIAALSVALVKHLSFFFPGLQSNLTLEISVAAAVILLLSFINYRGIKRGSNIQNLFTVLVIVSIFLLIILGFSSHSGDISYLNPPLSGDSPLSGLLGPAMIAVIFTYSGWFASCYIAGEIKDAERNLPLSIIGGALIVTALYLALNLVYLYALPVEEMKGVVNVAQKASMALLGPEAGLLVSGVIIVAILGSINAAIATAPRVYWAMARDGIFPEKLAMLHPRYKTPHISILLQALLASAMVFIGRFEQLLSYVVFAMLLSSIACGLSVFVLRIRYPDMRRPYKTPGYPITPLLFIGAYLWIAVQILINRPCEAMVGIAIIATGIPFYLYWKRRGN